MSEKERYATIGTWAKVFEKETGEAIVDDTVRSRMRAAGIVGIQGITKEGLHLPHGFYAESDVRQACKDLLNPLNAAYFQNLENVRADLTAFAKELGPDKSPADLSTGNIPSLSITTQSGQTIRGKTYLAHAAIALGFAKGAKEASSQLAKTLKHLLRLVGHDIPEHFPLNEAYFQNLENVRVDLTAFAKELGPDKSPIDLTTRNIISLSITAQNRQAIKGGTYLYHAAKALGFAEGAKEANSQRAKTLKHLLTLAGFNLLDTSYFQNQEYVKADLTAFAKALGPDKSPKDLSTGNFQSLSITTQNRQTIKGATYLNHASKALGFAKSTREASSQQSKTLRRLKEIAGYLTEKR